MVRRREGGRRPPAVFAACAGAAELDPAMLPERSAFFAAVATGRAGPVTAATADLCARNDRRAARRFESQTRSGAGMAARNSASKRAASVNLAETSGHASVILRCRRR